MQNEFKFNGKVLSSGTNVRTVESTGSTYQYHSVMITEGPLKGIKVPGKRTLKNANGDVKDPVNVGDEVIVYIRQVPDANDPTKSMFFYEIGNMMNNVTNDEVAALLGVSISQDVLAEQEF